MFIIFLIPQQRVTESEARGVKFYVGMNLPWYSGYCPLTKPVVPYE